MVENARTLASVLSDRGMDIVSGGTDTHMVLVDLRPKGLTGRDAEEALERAGITCNKNAIPFDPEKPSVTSGLRLGTPVPTTRGFGVTEFRAVGGMIAEILDGLAADGPGGNGDPEDSARERVHDLCRRFPIYTDH